MRTNQSPAGLDARALASRRPNAGERDQPEPNTMSETESIIPREDQELIQRIESALDTIRPYLMADGGAVRLLDITQDYVVELELLGACGTCPMSAMTLRAGIEQTLKRSIPQITRVEAVSAPLSM